MSISIFERNATIAEMAVEMDRRGAAIERLEAQLAAAEAKAARPETALAGRDALFEAIRAVQDATADYLPPDGISAQECLNRILTAVDNPTISAVTIGGQIGRS